MEACPYYTGFLKERLDCSQVLLVRDCLQSSILPYYIFFRLLDLLTSHSAPPPPFPVSLILMKTFEDHLVSFSQNNRPHVALYNLL